MVSYEAAGRQEAEGETQLAVRHNFSVRLPPDLYLELTKLRDQSGRSINSLIAAAVASLVSRPDLDRGSSRGDINPQIARDAVRQGPEAIGALKGIAKHANNRDQTALACVLWAAAARLVATTDDQGPHAASLELAHTAHVAESNNHFELAVALWEEALRLDPNNLDATNRLGQRLHHLAQRSNDDIERYRQAERYLARVTFVDNHAKLFHGWSALHVARADKDADLEQRSLAEIDESLKAWAFGQRDGHERRRWMRHVRRLGALGYAAQAHSLVDFANRNARWGEITPPDLEAE